MYDDSPRSFYLSRDFLTPDLKETQKQVPELQLQMPESNEPGQKEYKTGRPAGDLLCNHPDLH